MTIAVITASSVADKHRILYEAVKESAPEAAIVDLGCREGDELYSYIDISVMVGMLLSSGSVDFVVTGCSSGQGMMLACNSLPGVLCGYAPSPMDAYLFAQINNGNAISLPLAEGYTWTGEDNLRATVRKLFSEPFGGGYPKGDEDRKKKDTLLLKEIRKNSQKSTAALLDTLDADMTEKLLRKHDVISLIMSRGSGEVLSWIHDKFERKDEMTDNGIELHRPSLNELSFRELMLSDEETMSYNRAWGGTVPFPMEDWADWYEYWVVNAGVKRFYRYIKDSSSGEFIGEIAYHYDEERQIHVADVIVFSQHRNKGYGTKALRLLCEEAADRGVEVLYDDIAIDNPGISIFLREGFSEEYRTNEIIMLRKDLRIDTQTVNED